MSFKLRDNIWDNVTIIRGDFTTEALSAIRFKRALQIVYFFSIILLVVGLFEYEHNVSDNIVNFIDRNAKLIGAIIYLTMTLLSHIFKLYKVLALVAILMMIDRVLYVLETEIVSNIIVYSFLLLLVAVIQALRAGKTFDKK